MNLASLLATAALAFAPGPQVAERPLAPDGKPGLGDSSSLRDLLEGARVTHDAGREFVGQLLGLAAEVRLQQSAAAETYRAAGYFELGVGEDDVATLAEVLRTAQADPVGALAGGGERAHKLATALLDTRLRARLRLGQGVELDAREVSSGLAVLRGADEGFVQLEEREAQAIARRVDLAASRLRARRIDFLALRGRSGPRAKPADAPRESPDIAALLAAAAEPDPVRARMACAPLLQKADEHAELMWSALAFARLEADTAETLAWRERALAEGARLRKEALTYLPETTEGRAAPMEIASLRKHERVRWSGFRAREGLAQDPLDDVLAYAAAHAADFQWGSLESRPLFDRFLVLRGIRHYDSRTLQGRKLDDWEEEALLSVQKAFEPPPRRPPPDKSMVGGR